MFTELFKAATVNGVPPQPHNSVSGRAGVGGWACPHALRLPARMKGGLALRLLTPDTIWTSQAVRELCSCLLPGRVSLAVAFVPRSATQLLPDVASASSAPRPPRTRLRTGWSGCCCAGCCSCACVCW